MATSTLAREARPLPSPPRGGRHQHWPIWRALRWCASLKVTVVLFAAAIILVLAGTLAQAQHDVWVVVHQYFRTAFVWIPLQVFFPKSFFPNLPPIPGHFPFLGGWAIGALMAVNLVAAHAVRFTAQVRGPRLWGGLLTLAAGVGVTTLVVLGGSMGSGIQGQPFFAWSTLWYTMLGVLGVGALAALAGSVFVYRGEPLVRTFLVVVSTVCAGFVAWLLSQGQAMALGDSSMRILWQLLQGAIAGVVLLAGCWLLFRQRAGIVLLHSGIGLMMFSELLVGTTAVEGQMHIKEGEALNYVHDIRTTELAFVRSIDPLHDAVVVIPESRLRRRGRIEDPQLPCDVEVLSFFKNSQLRRLKADEKPVATEGFGKTWTVDEQSAATGTESAGRVDDSAAYVRLLKKGTDEVLGTHMVGLYLLKDFMPVLRGKDAREHVTIDGATHELALRFKRTYKPYWVQLDDVRTDVYLGTSTARNYSSDVRLLDPSRGTDFKVSIWMNNPLRYAGETFYQTQVLEDPVAGAEMTGLQVVTNTGWMIPYISCMIVAVGMLYQFSVTLLRYLRRLEASRAGVGAPVATVASGKRKSAPVVVERPTWVARWIVPTAIVAMAALYLGGRSRLPSPASDGLKLYEFGKLPVVDQGRSKPIDTLARVDLRMISNTDEYVDEKGVKQPAIRWLLDVISGSEAAEKHKVFRIDSAEVREVLGLERRSGFRYSIREFQPKVAQFEEQVDKARELSSSKLNNLQRKLLHFDQKLKVYTLLLAAFRPPPIPSLADFRTDREKAMAAFEQVLVKEPQRLARFKPPLAIPVRSGTGETEKTEWQPYATAYTKAYVQAAIFGQEPDAPTVAWNTMLSTYAAGDASAFNQAVSQYQAELREHVPAELKESRTSFEAYFNQFAPFYHASVLYLLAFVLTSVAWFPFARSLNWSAFCLILFVLLLHTLALVARIVISGRPPVTNLYSSAVFIGWGCVALGLVLESLTWYGLGNAAAALAGFATLLIAHFLSGDGDTFTVLQAVLDTQFWLATHVVCITLGYATTLLAGVLGMLAILGSLRGTAAGQQWLKESARLIYGVLCFAIFFSFVGTVLGGLWADDSWGRFWGWDPKENGALIIVLWNALVLHARWDKMVGDRGLALLAIGGNITTSWSWFGVNELGVGLHSYGFTEGVLMALGGFVLTQLLLIAVGLLSPYVTQRMRTANAGLTAP